MQPLVVSEPFTLCAALGRTLGCTALIETGFRARYGRFADGLSLVLNAACVTARNEAKLSPFLGAELKSMALSQRVTELPSTERLWNANKILYKHHWNNTGSFIDL